MRCILKTFRGTTYNALFDGAIDMDDILDMMNDAVEAGHAFIALDGLAIIQVAHIVEITEVKEMN